MAADSTDMTSDSYQLDRRLTILETRFDTILPTLATKADLAELKAELRGKISSLSRWMAAMFVTMVIGFAGMVVALLQRG
jgi:hypothetical protein